MHISKNRQKLKKYFTKLCIFKKKRKKTPLSFEPGSRDSSFINRTIGA